MKTFVARFVSLLCAYMCAVPSFLQADVVVNEVMSAGSERALQWSPSGVPQFGFGTPWHAIAFDDSSWQTGVGPFGFGSFANASPTPTVGTNLATQMQNLTPTLYLRKTFTVSETDAARNEPLQLTVSFNDGFVCYINGVEVARRNAGPANQFVYHDQFAAYGTPANNESSTTPYLRTDEVLPLPVANSILVPGTNVIAIHALNYWESTSVVKATANTDGSTSYSVAGVDNRNNFYFKADLRIGNRLPIVRNNMEWRYFPGVTEPSGGVYDPALLFSAKQSVPWGKTAFDDTSWATGASPFGAGNPPSGVTLGTNLTSQVIGKATSVYFRKVFNVTSADLANTQALQLLMDHDDSFVAYINGVEVARDRLGLANAFTPYDSVADSARSPGTSATYNLDPPARLLTEGQNVLSVQVHNLTLADSDLFFRCLLRTNPSGANPRTLVNYTDTWNYIIGTQEPLQTFGEAEEDNPEAPDTQLDWIELHNNGSATVALDGWYLSDDPADAKKWRFPAGTNIPAGGYLLVVCDGANVTAPASGGYLHTNFKLSAEGETVALSNSAGQRVQELVVPALTPFQSYGLSSTSQYAYLSTPTPRLPNVATALDGIVAAPTFSRVGGFYTGAQSVTLSTSTAGATIRYTTDGSEPTETTGTVATGAISVSTSSALRARAFKAGMIPSRTTTQTYLINEPANRKGVPALCITADQQRSLYRPFGIMAINGGSYPSFAAPLPTNNNGIWTQTGPTSISSADLSAYNNAIHRGRFLERPAVMELLYPSGAPGLNTEFGMRISGSGHARPRYQLTDQNRDPNSSPGSRPNDGQWSQSSFAQKPSFNFYFRGDMGGNPLDFPLYPGSPVTQFHDLRCRAGKNDIQNPFVEDEFMRRLFIDMGQVGSRGMINTFYVNGVYKGYYNLCEHLREEFFQRHYGSDLAWDVRQVTSIASGDGLAYQEMITFLRNNPQNIAANYQAMKTRVDMVNLVDYLIVNLFGNTGDWPHNNYVVSRERSAKGLHRFHVWDAEGAFGDFSGTVRTNQFVSGTTGSIVYASDASAKSAGLGDGCRILYHFLRASPEFKLLFADRLHKHFFNGGALTESAVFARWNPLKSEIQQLLGATAMKDLVTDWVNGVGNSSRYTLSGGTTGSVVNNPSRRKVLFEGYSDDTAGGVFVPAQLVAEGLWPSTLAPVFSKFGGNVTPGFGLTITNPNPGGAGTIYYTMDGRDPRAEGGAVAGTAYSGTITINLPTTVRARVRSTAGVWSPLIEAYFDTGTLPSLLITEIMYHPPDNGAVDGNEYEFLEIKNTGTQTVNLYGFTFTSGITYSFPPGATIAPGAHRVIARNAAQFAAKYPSVPLLDSWGPASALSNSGETLTLSDASGRTIFSVTWSDMAPWPAAADGDGPSLVPVNPNSIPSPDNPTNWRASTASGGSPGADDPAPAVLPVYVNELLANPNASETDRVELYNPNSTAVDIGYWWLSDDIKTPKKFRTPAGTVIPANGYLVIDESQFNAGATSFAFSSTGEEVILSSGDATGTLTGYSHSFQFGASEPGVSFGRYLNSRSAEFFVPQASQTFGAANSGPRPSPVTLAELMILPAAGGDEFVEVRNTSSKAVPLYDPANPSNTWKIDGIGFTFPPGVILQPGQIVLVVPIAPATFASTYNVSPAIAIYGPYGGALSNTGERITLQKPGPPYVNNFGQTVVPYMDVDFVTYDDVAPWPDVFGNGRTLERINAFAFGDDPQNWRATAVGGTVGKSPTLTLTSWLNQRFTSAQLSNPSIGGRMADPDGDGLVNIHEWALGRDPWAFDATSAVESDVEQHSDGQFYLTIRYRRNLSASGLTTFVDTSADLSAWNLNNGITVGSPINNGDGTETITSRDTVPSNPFNAPRRFIRLRVSAP